MAGYQTIEALRPILHRGPPPAPVVNRALVRPNEVVTPSKRTGRPRGAPLSPDVIAEIIARREKGESQRFIAAALGCSAPAVRKHSAHVPPPPGGWKPSRPPSIKRNKPFAERLRRAGFTYLEIAEELGCCESQAYYLLNRRRFVGIKSSPMSRLVQSVARATGISCAQLRKDRDEPGGRADPRIGKARHILFWLGKNRLEKNTLQGIGRSLGGFDHSSIIHGLKRADAVIAAYSDIKTDGPAVRVARALWQADWAAVDSARKARRV